MKIEMNAGTLLGLVRAAKAAVPSRTTRPVLECVKLTARDGGVCVEATDLDVGLRQSAGGVAVQRAGEAAVKAERLLAVLADVPGDVRLTADGDTLLVERVGAKGKWQVPAFDPSEFPSVPELIAGGSFTASSADLLGAIGQAEYAANKSDNSPRYAVNGLLFEADAAAGKAVVVGTDLKRIGTATTPCNCTGDWPASVLVPLKAVKAACGILGDGEVSVTANANEVLFTVDGAVVYSRLVSGKFPMWRQIVPKKSSHTFGLCPVAFGKAVADAAKTSDEESKRVDIAFSPGKAVLVARGPDTGRSEVEVDLPGVEFELDIAFDPSYLQAVCRSCLGAGDDTMGVEITDREKPAVFKWSSGMALVMPMGL